MTWIGIRNLETETNYSNGTSAVKSYKMSKAEIEKLYGSDEGKTQSSSKGYQKNGQLISVDGVSVMFNIELVKSEMRAGMDKEAIGKKYPTVKKQLLGRIHALATKQMEKEAEVSKKVESREERETIPEPTKGAELNEIPLDRPRGRVEEKEVEKSEIKPRVKMFRDSLGLGGARWI